MYILQQLKKGILGVIWPSGKEATIRRGPLKGYRFIVSKNSGWSPIAGRWEPQAQLLFTRIIKEGSVVYDLGANNGIHSLLFSKLVGKSGKVYCFEPLESNCTEIESNARLNDATNIHIVNSAVSDQVGETVFHLGLHDKQGSLVGIGRESGLDIKVKLETLDEFINKGNPPPDFLKIDIEGAESMALQGFSGKIRNVLPVFFIELHSPDQDKAVGDFFIKNGYNVYRLIDEGHANALNIAGLEAIKDLTKPYPHPDGIWGTILAVHPSKAIL